MYFDSLHSEFALRFKLLREKAGLFVPDEEYQLLATLCGMEYSQNPAYFQRFFLKKWKAERAAYCRERDGKTSGPFSAKDMEGSFSQVKRGLDYMQAEYNRSFGLWGGFDFTVADKVQSARMEESLFDWPVQLEQFGFGLLDFVVAQQLPRTFLLIADAYNRRAIESIHGKSPCFTCADLSADRRWLHYEMPSDRINEEGGKIADWFEQTLTEYDRKRVMLDIPKS